MPIRVLIVDDSAFMRQILAELLRGAADIEVVGAAMDANAAREQIKILNPDVLTLDINMPGMDGLEFLRRLMSLRPMPVVVISSLTQKGSDTAARALQLGAVDCVAKPDVGLRDGLEAKQQELIGKVRAAAAARPRAQAPARPAERLKSGGSTRHKVVLIGASTGGVEAITTIMNQLPAEIPPILITQHMPTGFTAAFARRLHAECAMQVEEASHGRLIEPGHVYLAPGGQHLEVMRDGATLRCRVSNTPPVSGHRPSVDVLFNSAAVCLGAEALGIILTGMGRDGANGLLAMRRAGARTLGQDEASCVVYGMPQAAMAAGAVMTELPLQRIAKEILAYPAAKETEGPPSR